MSAAFQFFADMPLMYLFTALGITAAGVAYGADITIPAIVGDLGLAVFAFAIGIPRGPMSFIRSRARGR